MDRSPRSLLYLIGAVAVIALVLAVLRTEGDPVLGLLLVLLSMAGLAASRMSQTFKSYRSRGLALTRRRVISIVLSSTMSAILIIAMADATFLAIRSILPPGCLDCGYSIEAHEVFGGTVTAILVARGASQVLWRPESRPGRHSFWRLWLMLPGFLMVVTLATGSNILRERYERHRVNAAACRATASDPATPRRSAVEAEYYARWHGRAAIRPWLPDHPPPIPTGSDPPWLIEPR